MPAEKIGSISATPTISNELLTIFSLIIVSLFDVFSVVLGVDEQLNKNIKLINKTFDKRKLQFLKPLKFLNQSIIFCPKSLSPKVEAKN